MKTRVLLAVLTVISAIAIALALSVYAQEARGLNIPTPPLIAGNATQNATGLMIASYVNILVTERWIKRVNMTANALNMSQLVMPYIENASIRLEECKALYDEGKYLDALLCSISARKIAIKAWLLLTREKGGGLRLTWLNKTCLRLVWTLERRAKYLEQLALKYNMTERLEEIRDIMRKLEEYKAELVNATTPSEICEICRKIAELRRELAELCREITRLVMPIQIQIAANRAAIRIERAFIHGGINATEAITHVVRILEAIRNLTMALNITPIGLNNTLVRIEAITVKIIKTANATGNTHVIKCVLRKLERLEHTIEGLGAGNVTKKIERMREWLERRLEMIEEKTKGVGGKGKEKVGGVEKMKRRLKGIHERKMRKGLASTTSLRAKFEEVVKRLETRLGEMGLGGVLSGYIEKIREKFEECLNEGDYQCAMAVMSKLEKVTEMLEKGPSGIIEMIRTGVSNVSTGECINVCERLGIGECPAYCAHIPSIVRGGKPDKWLCDNCPSKCKDSLYLACTLACLYYGGDSKSCVSICSVFHNLISTSICRHVCSKCGIVRPVGKP